MTVPLNEFFGVKASGWRIMTNNYCPLNCEFCATLCDKPIDPDAEYPDRRDKWDTSLRDVRLLCRRFKGIDEGRLHRLAGGEPTAMPLGRLEAIIDTLHSHGRPVSMLTNGYNLMGMKHEYLNELRQIVLDDHGINHDHIMSCMRWLKKVYKGRALVMTVTHHYDFEMAMGHPLNLKDAPCRAIMRSPSLFREAIYPCCASYQVEMMEKTTRLNRELRRAGWSMRSADVVETLRNWRETLPEYFWELCFKRCFKPQDGVGTKKQITLKPNDVIRAPARR